jgi:mRNA interferase RelE/StbE
MKYKVTYADTAIEDLLRLDKSVRIRIMKWVNRNLVDAEAPTSRGKPLVGDYKGYWRYRVGDYRLIAEILNDVLVISVVAVGHRKDIYRARL